MIGTRRPEPHNFKLTANNSSLVLLNVILLLECFSKTFIDIMFFSLLFYVFTFLFNMFRFLFTVI